MKAFILFFALFACAAAKPQFIYNSWPYAAPLTYNTWSAPQVTYTAAAPATQVTYAAAPAAQVTYAAAPQVTYTAAPAPALVATVPVATKTQYHAQDELGQASFGYSHPGQAHAAVRDAFGGVRGTYAYIGADGKEVRVNYIADAVNGYRVESNALPVAPTVPVTPALIAPLPVVDTPEVAEAKAAHMKAIEEAKRRNEEADKMDAMEKAQEGIMEMEAAPSPEMKAEAEPEAPKSEMAMGTDAEAISSRKKRDLVTTYAAYSHAPLLGHAYQAPVLAYSALPAVRPATLTQIVNTPGHAVSYRVD